MSGMWRLLRGLKDRLYRWLVPPYRTLVVEEFLPKTLNRRTLYVVQEDGFEEQAAMLCPCGCGRVLQMNLIPDERPCWRLARHEDGTASLQRQCGGEKSAEHISGSAVDAFIGAVKIIEN